VSPNDKFTIALIGCRGMGMYDLKDHLKFPEIECGGLCDVDEKVLNERASEIGKLTGKTPKLFKDYRKVLEDKSIDAVIVGTPDHWHCLMATDACEAGKDVYVEKPLANSVGECEIMLNIARKYNRVVQVGQQQRSGQHWQDVVALVRSGKLGTIRKIKTWGYFDYGKTKSTRHTGAFRSGLRSMAWPCTEEAIQLQPFSWKLEILLGTRWRPDDRLGRSSS